jgi:uncharacterized membrane protein
MLTGAQAVLASGRVLSWGWFSIELTNLLIILAMLVVFVLALLVPFRRSHADRDHRDRS